VIEERGRLRGVEQLNIKRRKKGSVGKESHKRHWGRPKRSKRWGVKVSKIHSVKKVEKVEHSKEKRVWESVVCWIVKVG